MRNTLQSVDGQIVLMNTLLAEMASLRNQFDKLASGVPATRTAEARSGESALGVNRDNIAHLLKSLTRIRGIMDEVQQSIRSSDHNVRSIAPRSNTTVMKDRLPPPIS